MHFLTLKKKKKLAKRSRRCTSADVLIARSRRWPHEAAELLRGVADDYAASPPPRKSEQRFPVADIDLPRALVDIFFYTRA
jgi:hypothetical protein